MRKRKKQFIRALALALMAAILAVPASAATVGGAVVHTNDTGLNLRAEATTLSDSMAMLPNGAFLLVEEALDGWYQVVWNGQTGYVSSDFADFSETLDGGYAFDAATLGTDVNLRAGADVSAQLVKSLPAGGSALTVTGVAGNWLKVRDTGGTEGYIRSDLVGYKADAASAPSVPASEPQTAEQKPAPVTTPAPAATALGAQIAAAAEQYIGYSYAWGGSSPSTGFDCSGLVYYLYGQSGISLQRVAQDMYNQNGVAVSYGELQPGDLLFFGYSEDCVTHVAIYVGGGYMIHSSTYGTGVIRSNVESSGYYNRMYVGAKRIG